MAKKKEIKKDSNIRNEKDTKNKKVDFSRKSGILDIKGHFKEFKFASNTKRCFLINMKRRNGTKDHFLVYPSHDYFIHNKRLYLIDNDAMIYDNSTRTWSITYHEDLSIPLKDKLDVQNLKTQIANNEKYKEISSSADPESLYIYMKSSFVQKIMRGEELDKVFKMLKLLGGISAIAGVLTLIILLKTSGVLSGILP